jgi:molecular chaperone DnaK
MTDQPQTFAVGIDFGTTNSTICLCPPDGRPAIVPIRQLPDDQTLPWLPGFIYFPSGRKVIVGQAARRYYHLKPHRTVRSVKRDLDRVFTVGGRTYSGADLVLFITRHLLRECRETAGAVVREAVLTVPATFGHRERKTLREALLETSRSIRKVYLLDEPLAAFMAHANDTGVLTGPTGGAAREHVLIADMGGGTTDLAVLRLENAGGRTHVSPLAVWSHLSLGGDDFDRFVAQDIAVARAEAGLMALERLTDSERKFLRAKFVTIAEDIKMRLGSPPRQLEVTVDGLPGEASFAVAMNGERYGRLTRPLTDAFIESIRYVLERGNLLPGDIGRVILTGGMSRAAVVRGAAEDFFGRKAELSPDPESAVARGACYYHASLLRPDRGDIETLRPVMTRALFLRMQGGRMLRVLPSCQPVPARTTLSHLVSPVIRCQALRLPFYQGNDDGSELASIVTLTLGADRAMRPGSPVTVEVDVDENKMIAITARTGPADAAGPPLRSSATVWGL